MSQTEYFRRNQAAWAARQGEPELAATQWATEPNWGVFGVPETSVGMLPELAGRDVLELGCGTAYVSAWVARAGGRPVGLDVTPQQLATARRMQAEYHLAFPLVLADGERVPLRGASFDVVVSEYGACIWCDPYRWVPEAARLLRPGGELIFLGNATVFMLCAPDTEAGGGPTDRMVRPYFDMHRFEWPDADEVEFHLGYGDWIRLLRREGFDIEDMIEVRPPADAVSGFVWATADWARRWPLEEIWKARKR